MRLIDADKLKKNWNGIETPVGYRKVVDFQAIDDTPTVEERPKGKWEHFHTLANGNVERKCSNCGSIDEQFEDKVAPYCWYCGAEMLDQVEHVEDCAKTKDYSK